MVVVILLIVGLCLGSFINALVWRLHQQSLDASRQSKSRKTKTSDKQLETRDFKNLSILKGRSMCPDCHHVLAAKDLMPVFSWVWLRGRCRYCRKPISWQYPLVELLTAALLIKSYYFWPLTFNNMGTTNFIFWCLVLVGFIALLIYDLKWLLLPNKITYPLAFLALIISTLNITVFGGGIAQLRDIAISILISAGLFWGLYELSKGKWIGGGDVKLGLIIGLLIAVPAQAFLVLFLASLIGTIVILPGLASKKLKATSHIPFGPFLIVATIIVRLFGASMIAWYRRKFLIY